MSKNPPQLLLCWLVIGGVALLWMSAVGATPVDAGPPPADAGPPPADLGAPPISPEDQALVESLEFIEALEMMEGLDVLVDHER